MRCLLLWGTIRLFIFLIDCKTMEAGWYKILTTFLSTLSQPVRFEDFYRYLPIFKFGRYFFEQMSNACDCFTKINRSFATCFFVDDPCERFSYLGLQLLSLPMFMLFYLKGTFLTFSHRPIFTSKINAAHFLSIISSIAWTSSNHPTHSPRQQIIPSFHSPTLSSRHPPPSSVSRSPVSSFTQSSDKCHQFPNIKTVTRIPAIVHPYRNKDQAFALSPLTTPEPPSNPSSPPMIIPSSRFSSSDHSPLPLISSHPPPPIPIFFFTSRIRNCPGPPTRYHESSTG